MLDIKNNLDVVNYVVQESIKGLMNSNFEVQNNIYKSEDFGVDILSRTRKKLTVRIRNMTAMNICRIEVTDKSVCIRYTHEFMFFYDPKTDKFTSNLLEQPFELDDISAAFFTESTMIKFDVDWIFDYDIMIETLDLCRGLYAKFIQFNEDR